MARLLRLFPYVPAKLFFLITFILIMDSSTSAQDGLKQKILAGYQNNRSQITDIQYKATFRRDFIIPPAKLERYKAKNPSKIRFQELEVWKKDDMMMQNISSWTSLEKHGPGTNEVHSWNQNFTSVYQRDIKKGELYSENQLAMADVILKNILLEAEPWQPRNPFTYLPMMVSEPDASLKQSTFEGSSVYELIFDRKRVLIDPNRGYWPIRVEQKSRLLGKNQTEIEITLQMVKTHEGTEIWYPATAKRTRSVVKNDTPDAEMWGKAFVVEEYTISDVKLNQNLTREFFTFKFPIGTHIYDARDINHVVDYIVGGVEKKH